MNTIKAQIIKADYADELVFLSTQSKFGKLSVLMLDAFKLSVKADIVLLFKEQDLILAKSEDLALENLLNLKVRSIHRGQILTQVFFDDDLSSVLSNEAFLRLKLKIDDEILGFISSSSISIKVV